MRCAIKNIGIAIRNQFKILTIEAFVNSYFEAVASLTAKNRDVQRQVRAARDEANPLHMMDDHRAKTRWSFAHFRVVVDASEAVDVANDAGLAAK